jgi:aspartate 1-decarboxylase
LLQSNYRVSIITPIKEAKGSNRLMQITLLKSKLHHANVTHAELEYEGSCAIDGTLLAAANIQEYEQIQIYNLNNGERFTTYAICAEDHSGIISVNGAAAHKANPGDRIIICTYAVLSQQEASIFKPTLVYLDENNRIKASRNAIPVQVA